MLIGISNFVRRQTPESHFAHFDGDDRVLINLTTRAFEKGNYSPGYRDGVVVVHMEPWKSQLFFTYPNSPWPEGTKLRAEYKRIPGREHEPPQVIVVPAGPKVRCNYVDVILYRRDVLEEDGDASTDAEWEIVSLNGRIREREKLISPLTVVRNWLHLEGGTEMKGKSAEDVLEMLCNSVLAEKGIKR